MLRDNVTNLPKRSGLSSNRVTRAMIVRIEMKIPDPPIPAMARPKIKKFWIEISIKSVYSETKTIPCSKQQHKRESQFRKWRWRSDIAISYWLWWGVERTEIKPWATLSNFKIATYGKELTKKQNEALLENVNPHSSDRTPRLLAWWLTAWVKK